VLFIESGSTMDNTEKISYGKFISKCIENINIIKREYPNKKTFFTISSTVKLVKNRLPYTTPTRIYKFIVITGCVVFTQHQAKLVAMNIDGKVDYILVDVEKKISFEKSNDKPEYISKEGDIKRGKTLEYMESGNISGEVIEYIQKSKFYHFKANDITVDSLWIFIEKKLLNFSGKKIAIIGCGNIGSKIALKLVESGCNVSVYRRDTYKGNIIVNAINIIKPKSTIAQVEYVDQIIKACFMADVVIGCTNGISAIRVEHLRGCKPEVICIDAGKGTFEKSAV